jgi:hypothetical protein
MLLCLDVITSLYLHISSFLCIFSHTFLSRSLAVYLASQFLTLSIYFLFNFISLLIYLYVSLSIFKSGPVFISLPLYLFIYLFIYWPLGNYLFMKKYVLYWCIYLLISTYIYLIIKILQFYIYIYWCIYLLNWLEHWLHICLRILFDSSHSRVLYFSAVHDSWEEVKNFIFRKWNVRTYRHPITESLSAKNAYF